MVMKLTPAAFFSAKFMIETFFALQMEWEGLSMSRKLTNYFRIGKIIFILNYHTALPVSTKETQVKIFKFFFDGITV